MYIINYSIFLNFIFQYTINLIFEFGRSSTNTIFNCTLRLIKIFIRNRRNETATEAYAELGHAILVWALGSVIGPKTAR